MTTLFWFKMFMTFLPPFVFAVMATNRDPSDTQTLVCLVGLVSGVGLVVSFFAMVWSIGP